MIACVINLCDERRQAPPASDGYAPHRTAAMNDTQD